MLHQHGTPYVTPHILHKSYAQSHDNNETSNREFPLLFLLAFLSRVVYYDALVACVSHRSYLLGYGAGMIHRACKTLPCISPFLPSVQSSGICVTSLLTALGAVLDAFGSRVASCSYFQGHRTTVCRPGENFYVL